MPADEADIGPKVSIRNLSKHFPSGTRRGDSFVALQNFSLDVSQGEFVCIVGASGCGKSTMLNIVSGLEDATDGHVLIEGDPVVGPGPDRGMVFQAYSLYPWKTVYENIAFGLEIAGADKATITERVSDLLGVMSLRDFADRLPKELSGGMRQRVAIARALAPEPDVLLLDEPFGALDALTKRSLQSFLRLIWLRTGTTIMMVTHDVPEAVFLSERVCVMVPQPGRIQEVIDVPFGSNRGPLTKRDPRFLDLVDEIEDMLHGEQVSSIPTPTTDVQESQ